MTHAEKLAAWLTDKSQCHETLCLILQDAAFDMDHDLPRNEDTRFEWRIGAFEFLRRLRDSTARP